MFEKEYIQSRGFKNISENGKVVGFQIPIRTAYYRGIWLSQLQPAILKVDGETFTDDQITWTIAGKTYAQKDFPSLGDVYWHIDELATLNVSKPGGLKIGYHDVELYYVYTICYLAPGTEPLRPMGRRMALVE